MARLTPLSKGILTALVVGVAGYAAWLTLKPGSDTSSAPAVPLSPATVSHSGQSTPASNPAVVATAAAGSGAAATTLPSGALGSSGNPLKVSIVSFHGYAPALVANGNSLTTQPGSIFARHGINVEFVIQDDVPSLATIFESGSAQCAWRTSDFWAQEQPNLRNAGLDAKAIMVVDNTQGADAVIASDPNIKRIEDLPGHSVAMLRFTPSHGLFTDAVESSSLTARKRQSIKRVFISAEEGTGGVRAAYTSGAVDAAVLWDPDLSLAMRERPGSHVVYSTETATNLIYDVIVCDSRVVANAQNTPTFDNFVGGWLEGVDFARANPDAAVQALMATEQFFTLLGQQEGAGFIKGLFNNLVWTNLADNARILGLSGGVNHYERVYARFDQIYRAEGALADPTSPVIAPQDSFDYRFVQRLLAKDARAKAEAAKPTETYSEAQRGEAMKGAARVTKPVFVNFPTGSSKLTKRAMRVIDTEMVPFIENNGRAYFELSGHTDGTGSLDTNMRLSRERADAVLKYLESEWEIPGARLQVAGYGPSRPICNEANPATEGMSLEDCRSVNRTTRLAVFQK